MAVDEASARRRFRLEAWGYGLFALSLVGGGFVYWLLAEEEAGTVLFAGTGGLFAIFGGYLAFQSRLQATAAAAHEGPVDVAPEEEPYLPHASVWPLELATGATAVLLGLVLGWAFLVPGLILTVHATGGWIVQSRRRA